jgi:hypothetical protein
MSAPVEWLGDGCDNALKRLALRTEATMDELFSHLSALREIDRRADIARQAQLNAILTRLEAIESRLDHLSNGGLRDSLLDAVPVLLQNAGLIKAETVKGKTEVIVALISVLSALGGAVIARWF